MLLGDGEGGDVVEVVGDLVLQLLHPSHRLSLGRAMSRLGDLGVVVHRFSAQACQHHSQQQYHPYVKSWRTNEKINSVARYFLLSMVGSLPVSKPFAVFLIQIAVLGSASCKLRFASRLYSRIGSAALGST